MWLPSLPSWHDLPLLRHWHLPSRRTARHVLYGLLLGVSLSLASTSVLARLRARRRRRIETAHGFESRPIELRSDEVLGDGVLGLIGNTPLVRIGSLSDALGVEILGKAEWLNPGGSVKDRVALRSNKPSSFSLPSSNAWTVIEDAEQTGFLVPHTGSRIFEGTVGSTGISIATVGRAKWAHLVLCLPSSHSCSLSSGRGYLTSTSPYA
jgi:cysteine synthase A